MECSLCTKLSLAVCAPRGTRIVVDHPNPDATGDRESFSGSVISLLNGVIRLEIGLSLSIVAGCGATVIVRHFNLFDLTTPELSTYTLLVVGRAGWVGLVRRKRA
jgi:hypothetical protein